ncbi:McrC family protein [Isoptericola sediminis]|uniref:Restriction endonuclease n=1 Tax=Isoptericola sediminis TaxID=2733572 RepID=A0A849JVH9_9MICO|nr:restriction endonuclease [Isoptericola sediminis]NNU27312.1 restriction endonuclease [Isoptericola sediminis]
MRVELPENDQSGGVLPLEDAAATALALTELVEVRRDTPTRWRILPRRNRIGAVRVGELEVVVRPKAAFASVMFMLGYARDPGYLPWEVDGFVEDDLWSAVGETLARLAERGLMQGVLQGYVTRDDALGVLRGRVRAADQAARRPGALLPLEVTYDEYEPDIAENRILRAALNRMMLVPRLPRRVHSRLGHLSGRLDGVSPLVPGAPLPAWRRTRMNLRYQPALQLAEVVLRSVGLSSTVGGMPVASFVVDMATVFEDFATTALRESLFRLSPRGRTVAQHQAWADEGERVRIKPDIVHFAGRQPRIVFDAKYKLGSEDGGYPTSDVYQMHAYCTALGLRRGYLVYAGSRAEGAGASTHRILNTEIDVVQWPLDVRAVPAELLDQIDVLAIDAGQYP